MKQQEDGAFKQRAADGRRDHGQGQSIGSVLQRLQGKLPESWEIQKGFLEQVGSELGL